MSPNRIDSNRSTNPATIRGTSPSLGVSKAPPTVPTDRPGADGDAVSTASHGALEAVRGETRRIDGARIAELGERVESGHYKVDPHALADRILDDALGPEVV